MAAGGGLVGFEVDVDVESVTETLGISITCAVPAAGVGLLT